MSRHLMPERIGRDRAAVRPLPLCRFHRSPFGQRLLRGLRQLRPMPPRRINTSLERRSTTRRAQLWWRGGLPPCPQIRTMLPLRCRLPNPPHMRIRTPTIGLQVRPPRSTNDRASIVAVLLLVAAAAAVVDAIEAPAATTPGEAAERAARKRPENDPKARFRMGI